MPVTTVLTQSLYPAGTYYSNPIAWPTGATMVTATGLLSDADVRDPSLKITKLAVEVSTDGGKSYFEVGGPSWQGGTLAKDGVSYSYPSVGAGYSGPDQQTPDHARVRLELPQPLSVGVTLG